MGLKQLKEANELPWGSDCWGGGIRSRPAVHQPAHCWGNTFGDEAICADDGDGDDRPDGVLMVTGELCEEEKKTPGFSLRTWSVEKQTKSWQLGSNIQYVERIQSSYHRGGHDIAPK